MKQKSRAQRIHTVGAVDERSECKPDRAQQSKTFGSGIAKRIPRVVVPITKRFGFGTTPARFARSPLLTQEGTFSRPLFATP